MKRSRFTHPSFRSIRRAAPVLFFWTLMGLLGAGCGTGSTGEDGVEEIRFCTIQLRPAFDDYFLQIFEEFERTHPGVKIRWLDLPFQNFQSKLITSFLGKHSPDVLNLSTEVIPDFARAEFILNLEPLASPELMDQYLPNIVKEGCGFRGTTYALPWYVATGLTMINRKIVEEAGISLDEVPIYYDDFPAFCKLIRERTDKFGYFQTYTESGSFRNWLAEAGIFVADPETRKATLNTPEAVRIVKFWTDFYRQGLVPSEALTAGHQRLIELYKTGRLAIFGSGPQFLRQIKADAPDVYENTVIRPQICWKGHQFYRADLQVLCISSQCKRPELALEFAAFVTNAKNQLEFCKLTTILPSVKAGLQDPFFTTVDETPQGQARKISAEQLKTAIVLQPVPKASHIFPMLDNINERICLGKISAEEGLREAEERANEILSK